MSENQGTWTAVFMYHINRLPDGTASYVITGDDTWLGTHHGWTSGGATPSSVHQTLADYDNPDIMNVIACPAIEPSDRPGLIAALKDNQAIEVDWSVDGNGTLVLRPPRIQDSQDEVSASGSASGEEAPDPILPVSAYYDAAISGALRVDSFCLSMKSIVEGDPDYDTVTELDQRGRGPTAPVRTRVQPVPWAPSQTSIAWETSYGARDKAYQDLQRFGKTKTQFRIVVDKAAHDNGFLYANRDVSEGVERWSHYTIPNGGGKPIYFGVAQGAASTYGVIRSGLKAIPIFGTVKLKVLEKHLAESSITVIRKCTGKGDQDTVNFSKTAEGLFGSEFTAVEDEVVFKKELPWTLDEQHRVICAGLKIE